MQNNENKINAEAITNSVVGSIETDLDEAIEAAKIAHDEAMMRSLANVGNDLARSKMLQARAYMRGLMSARDIVRVY